MPRSVPTWVTHFTHVDHLSSIVELGLVCDRSAKAAGALQFEVGNTGIKGQRSRRVVPVAPDGVVDDYVPFYFAPRSPMMSAISHGRVPQYTEGNDHLIYLCTTLEALADLGLEIVLSDRNAALDFAAFVRWSDGEPEVDFIDWPLMKQRVWANTPEHPDRRERRMAECLVHGSVPWEAFNYVGTKSEDVAVQVREVLAALPDSPTVAVHADWYL